MSSIPSVSSRPNVLSGARFAALTKPASAATAASGVARPTARRIAATSVRPAITRIPLGPVAAK
jgi:hypothetical protein